MHPANDDGFLTPFGTMHVSKHLEAIVMAVVDPKFVENRCGTPGPTAIEKPHPYGIDTLSHFLAIIPPRSPLKFLPNSIFLIIVSKNQGAEVK